MAHPPITDTQIIRDPFAAVRIPEYRHLMMGRFTFIAAMRMITTVISWWIYEITGDKLAIGLIGLAEVIPALSLALYAGHQVDKNDRKTLLLKGVAGYLLAGIALYTLSITAMKNHLQTKHITWVIYGIFFITGILRSFVGPCFSAMIATIVPKNLLQNATSWSQGIWLSASVTGHAIGGFMIAFGGVSPALLVIVIIIFISSTFLLQLKPKPPHPTNTEKKTWDSVKEGVAFVFRTKALLAAMALDMFAVLFGGAVAMIPVFAKDILKISPIAYGWLNAATDIGAITIIILLTLWPLKTFQGKKMLLAVAGFGSCIILFGVSKWFWLSFFTLILAGMLDGVSVVVRGTVVQLLTPDNMRGRVSSVSSMFVTSSNELGQFESGIMARAMGTVSSVIFGGCMTLAVVIATWFKAPTLRKFQY